MPRWVWIIVTLALGVAIMYVLLRGEVNILLGARQLACSMANRLHSAGLRFLVDLEALGC